MKETQQDFGLTAGPAAMMEVPPAPKCGVGCAEGQCTLRATDCPYKRPVYAPLAWAERNPTPNLMAPAPQNIYSFASTPFSLTPITSLPTDAKARKQTPIFSGVMKYFPDAIIAVAKCSFAGNEQHHPGQPLHWDKAKSTDHEDCLLRHLMDNTTGVPMDTDNIPHLAKVAWRALALLQTSIDKQRAKAA